MIDKNEITRRLQNWIDQMERSGKHVNPDGINQKSTQKEKALIMNALRDIL